MEGDGGWENWGSYDECSKSCNEGTKIRSRRCNNPLPSNGGSYCAGSSYEVSKCFQQKCPGILSPFLKFR